MSFRVRVFLTLAGLCVLFWVGVTAFILSHV